MPDTSTPDLASSRGPISLHTAIGGELGENDTTEYAIKQVGDRYYPVIIDREAGGHYEIKNPMTGGTLSYNNPEAAEKYLQRAREKGR